MTTLPRQMLVAPPVERHALAEPRARAARQRLTATWTGEDWAGRRVAVAVGSRGIDRIAEMAARWWGGSAREGAEPVHRARDGEPRRRDAGRPARRAGRTMASPKQQWARRSRRRWTSIEVGETAAGVQVVVVAACARAPTPSSSINRVKPHTDFDSRVLGSGLLKMSAIGLGKAEGAFRCHSGGVRRTGTRR